MSQPRLNGPPLRDVSARKLILRNHLAPGDLVLLTAAVRDLHATYPGRYLTDVRTSCPELWEHNPHLTSLREDDPEVRVLECHYPLIDRSNEAPYHAIHGFIQHLNQVLDLRIEPTAFHGDIHLSAAEKAWSSQIHELAGLDLPFWIVAGGGKFDYTIKWWSHSRYQAVVDHFHSRIQFVQVGELGHYHPALRGAIDLRGRTTLRQLIRLMHHAQGVLCGVTSLMHLAAAVETRGDASLQRPCVVVAGAREPAHWEAYPQHQFIHRNGALPCAEGGGCWRDRTVAIGDGSPHDEPEHLCVNPSGDLPRCMADITAAEVIDRIELHFRGGAARYLSPIEAKAAARAADASASNDTFERAVHWLNLRTELQRNPGLSDIEAPTPGRGRGLIVAAQGMALADVVRALEEQRTRGCRLPVEIWMAQEFSSEEVGFWREAGIELRDSMPAAMRSGARCESNLALALHGSSFREALVWSPQDLPCFEPDAPWNDPVFTEHGAMFFPDVTMAPLPAALWKACQLPGEPPAPGTHSLFLIDRSRCTEVLRWLRWINQQQQFFSELVGGEAGTFPLAFALAGRPYPVAPVTAQSSILPETSRCRSTLSF